MAKSFLSRQIKKAAQLFHLGEYAITHESLEREQIEAVQGVPAEAFVRVQAAYYDAHIVVADDLTQVEAWPIIIHEVAHIKYAHLAHIIEQCWKAKPRLNWAQARRLIDAEFEKLCEKDVSLVIKNSRR